MNAIDLNFREMGSGQPLIILHGLFGSSDNWQTIGKQLGTNHHVYLLDQRNHGQSAHSDVWNYEEMANDVVHFCKKNNLISINIVGHSMGGKTAMTLAHQLPELINKMMVIDISPKQYPLHHQVILEALASINFDEVTSRKQAEEALNKYIVDNGTKQFLLKNLYWIEEGRLAWRFNLPVIIKNIAIVGEATPANLTDVSQIACCFVKGEKSNYINASDALLITQLFPQSYEVIIENAGHWVHAENPQQLLLTMFDFFG